MSRAAANGAEAFTVEFPAALPVDRQGEYWWMEAGGIRLRLSNLEKVFWPEEGFTKGDLLAYYFNVASTIAPYLKDRPITMKRMPEGIKGGHFYQKDAPDYAPPWITRCAIEPEDGKVDEMIMVQGIRDLIYVVNLGCIELHPLHSPCERYDCPDYMVFDLDPSPPAGFREALIVASHVRTVCDRLGLRSYPKTSGATGLQIYVPVAESHSYEETRSLTERIARMIQKVDPVRVTLEWDVRRRDGKIFIDVNMNRRAASFASAYSVRPEPGATVSAPLKWEEVDEMSVRPRDFTIRSMLRRIDEVGDLFEGVLEPQSLDEALAMFGIPRTFTDISEGRLRRRIPPRAR
ncbi:MAG: non-homologous end-joining DNA ligase [Actinomycetota bacterium]|nr:non-homologous end-joining DNA ligase [Actinomycetota bacterium]